MTITLNEVDKVEILTLQDNYIDIASMDNTEIVHRAMPIKDMEIKSSILAEHGFSAMVTVTTSDQSRSILFDFGFSEQGAAFNADALGVDLTQIETLVLSHGHMDHFGGLRPLVDKIGKNIELVLHPTAFRKSRHIKVSEDYKIKLPSLSEEKIKEAELSLIESKDPRILLDGSMLFLGEIPKRTDFEKGFPRMFYNDADGQSKWDPIEEDSAVVIRLKGKGLVILSGCAHSGIINTVKYAQEITGIKKLYVVMGGFHLTGADFEPIIEPTTEALKVLNPEYVIPTHCTGRKAVMNIEKEMPDKFLLNMSGTRMVFEGEVV